MKSCSGRGEVRTAASGGGWWLPRPPWPRRQDPCHGGQEGAPVAHRCPPPVGSSQHHHGAQPMGTLVPPVVPSQGCCAPPAPGQGPLCRELSPALPRLAVPLGRLALPLSFCWPWIPHVPETTHIPHFAKNGKNCLRHLAGWLTGRYMLFWCCPRLRAAEGSQPPCQGHCWLCPQAPSAAPAEPPHPSAAAHPSPLVRSDRPRAPPRRCPTGTCIGCKTAASAEEPTPKKKQ